MSLLSALFNVGIARRVGIWTLLQALPDENALRGYLRAAYMALAGVIIGSVLTGAAIAAGIVAIYHLLVEAGISTGIALASTAGFTLLLILACFALAGRWFVKFSSIKDDMSLMKETKIGSMKNMVTDAVNSVAEGFMEGLTTPAPTQRPQRQPLSRRIRLIQ